MLRLCTDQWERIQGHFPEERIPEGRPGRKPVPANVATLGSGLALQHPLLTAAPRSRSLIARLTSENSEGASGKAWLRCRRDV